MSGDLDVLLQRFLPALLIVLTGLAAFIIFLLLPKRKTGNTSRARKAGVGCASRPLRGLQMP